jgi:hypothetical protein
MHPRRRHPGSASGYALVLVLIFTAISFLVLGAALSWSSTNANLIERHNHYYDTLAAAEAATEKVLAQISADYQTDGARGVTNNLLTYQTTVPTVSENSAWVNYQFTDAQGNAGRTYVQGDDQWAYQTLDSQFAGLYGLACTYRIISNARLINSPLNNLAVGLLQQIQLASIPLFQFAIFYAVDLEINPLADLRVIGRVHSNADIFTEPQGNALLDFVSDVTAAGQINAFKKPSDPQDRASTYNVVFEGLHGPRVSSLTLPIGTSNSPETVHAILEKSPAGEDRDSQMGRQRYYNKADLIILVADHTVQVTSGAFNNFSTAIASSEWTNFVTTNLTFFNSREGKTIRTTELDIGKLRQWSATNTTLRAALGKDVRAVFVADSRSQSGTTQSGVRVANGQTLPASGLTVATPNPLYVKGNYNAPVSALGTTNTSATLPASLVGDAVTILSTSWNDTNSTSVLGSRVAGDTTVNAAILTGNVPTGGGYYSGGVENLPRLLETWSGRILTYNGSMAAMFYSKIAVAPWGGTNVYVPPKFQWALDLNYFDPTRLPPGTPELRILVRGAWKPLTPNTIPTT